MTREFLIICEYSLQTSSIDLDDDRRVDNEVIYPEIGYFELARAIPSVKSQQKTTKGSRMSDV